MEGPFAQLLQHLHPIVASLIGNLGYDDAFTLVNGWAENARIMSNDVIALNSIRDDFVMLPPTTTTSPANSRRTRTIQWVWSGRSGRPLCPCQYLRQGVLANADDPDLAQQLLEWLATDGQNLFVDGNNEYPVNPDVVPESLIASEFGETFVRDALNAAEFEH